MLHLHYRREATVARISTATPGSLDLGLLDALAAAITYIGPHQPIVLIGAGRVFAPDLDRRPGTARERLSAVLGALRAHPLPVVAAINGDAIGAGYALAEAADTRIMSGGVVQPSTRTASLTASAAVAAGLVDLHCSPARLLDLALRLACHNDTTPALGRIASANA